MFKKIEILAYILTSLCESMCVCVFLFEFWGVFFSNLVCLYFPLDSTAGHHWNYFDLDLRSKSQGHKKAQLL